MSTTISVRHGKEAVKLALEKKKPQNSPQLAVIQSNVIKDFKNLSRTWDGRGYFGYFGMAFVQCCWFFLKDGYEPNLAMK